MPQRYQYQQPSSHWQWCHATTLPVPTAKPTSVHLIWRLVQAQAVVGYIFIPLVGIRGRSSSYWNPETCLSCPGRNTLQVCGQHQEMAWGKRVWMHCTNGRHGMQGIHCRRPSIRGWQCIDWEGEGSHPYHTPNPHPMMSPSLEHAGLTPHSPMAESAVGLLSFFTVKLRIDNR